MYEKCMIVPAWFKKAGWLNTYWRNSNEWYVFDTGSFMDHLSGTRSSSLLALCLCCEANNNGHFAMPLATGSWWFSGKQLKAGWSKETPFFLFFVFKQMHFEIVKVGVNLSCLCIFSIGHNVVGGKAGVLDRASDQHQGSGGVFQASCKGEWGNQVRRIDAGVCACQKDSQRRTCGILCGYWISFC